MAKQIGLLIAVVGYMVLTTAEPTAAQGRNQSWSKGPTFSPYMQMFGKNRGPMNNYFDYVRPRQEFQKYVQNQETRYQNLSSQLQQTQQNQYQLFPHINPFQRNPTGGLPGQVPGQAFNQLTGQPSGQLYGANPQQAGGVASGIALANPRGGVGMPSRAGFFQNHNQFFMGANRASGTAGGGRGGRGRGRR